jgi:exopolyphosphatase/pppGpp-phosphohydrolase
MATQRNRLKSKPAERAVAESAAPARATKARVVQKEAGSIQRSPLSDSQAASIESLLGASNWEQDHVRQVRRLAVRIFDSLREYHALGADEQILLEAGALLHDIGYPIDPARHHKVSARIIRAVLGTPFDREAVELIALLARYHRKGIPRLDQRRYAELDDRGRRLISWLGGILRVADGLDREHDASVVWVQTAVVDGRLEIRVSARLDPLNRAPVGDAQDTAARLASQLAAATAKRDLLERAMGMPVVIRAI